MRLIAGICRHVSALLPFQKQRLGATSILSDSVVMLCATCLDATQGAAKKPRKSTAALADLLGWGLIAAGATLTISYKGQRREGILTEDAQILFQGAEDSNKCRQG